jgi:hypothetical protein
MTDNLRPFDFADLAGAPEPESWGPKYSKPAKPSAKPIDRCPTNCASGQKYTFDAKKHRATLLAKLYADINADRRRRTDAQIISAYIAAMDAKRARLARETLPRRFPLVAA